MQLWQLIVCGVLVHLVLFYSIFDIYFTTPLVHGMTPVHPPGKPPAKRLFLFVADGLRADKFYEPDENGKYRAPYLRNIMEREGVWGISHTRVPTESRPGHVALIAGFYEDVSAVAKGWKENPVEFDSVFNETRHTWSWGSPDILPMFAKGATGKHVNIHCYSAEFEDFGGSDKTKLDTWVFERVEEFFSSASTNESLKHLLHKDKVVFFLHLLGVDTNGHSSKPHSREYLNNIKLVDVGVKQVVEMTNKFYNHDGKTAFVFTSDHGMTDWGSHGAGHDHETLTPLVAWGAGIRQPVMVDSCGVDTDPFCQEWRMSKIKRTDVEQADVAPLMSSLIGVPFPINSVGKLPIDVLSGSDVDRAELLLANAIQILASFQVKMEQVKARTISVMFRPFQELKQAERLQSEKHIRDLIRTGHHTESITETNLLIEKALRGLRYYQTYDRLFLGVSIAFGFMGWMLYVMSILGFEHTAIGKGTLRDSRTPGTLHMYFFMAVAGLVIVLLYVQHLPLMCYAYCLLPILLWYKSSGWLGLLWKSMLDLDTNGRLLEAGLTVIMCALGLEIVVFSFYYRQLLSVGLVVLSLRPLVEVLWNRRRTGSAGLVKSSHNSLTPIDVGWMLSCLVTAIFPLMPVVGKHTHYDWILYGSVLSIGLGVGLVWRLSRHSNTGTTLVLATQLFLVVLSLLIVMLTASSIRDRKGLPVACQMGSWTILLLSGILPLLTPTRLTHRLLSLSMAFMAPYLMLSIAYEVFFFTSMSCLLYFWLMSEAQGKKDTIHENIEQLDFLLHRERHTKDNSLPSRPSIHHHQQHHGNHMEFQDLHRAFIFIFLIVTAFFGTGNIASINSFDPVSVYCFLTVFNPFWMGALLLFKNVIPFLLVTCGLQAVQVVTGTSLRTLILITLILSDFMGLHFFFLVRDEGSWLEIGTTISHYVIVMTIIIFIMLLVGVSHVLTGMRLIPSSGRIGTKSSPGGKQA